MIRLNKNDIKYLIRNILKESIDNDKVLVGYVKGSNVDYANGDFFILSSHKVINSSNIDDILQNTVITKDEEGFGSGYLYYFTHGEGTEFVHILPEYKSTFIEYAFKGMPNNVKEKMANELLSTINSDGNNAIITHDSKYKISDGFIKVGMPQNAYSKSDFKGLTKSRSYFWGTSYGKDVEYGALYRYFCKYPLDKIYPIQFDPLYLGGIDNIVKNGYNAIAYYMNNKKEHGTVVVCFEDVQIEYIKPLNDYSTKYNNKWQKIEDGN